MHLVSIITPVYNAARWLPETLASVQAQTLTDWEHLLVDDGSTDESAMIVVGAAVADRRIRLLRTAQNSGPGAARNVALDAARGRFIAFLDADDVWYPEKLAKQTAWMESHGYVFTYHNTRLTSHDRSRLGAIVEGPRELNLRTLHTHRGTGGCMSVMIDRERIPGFRFPAWSRDSHEDFVAWLSLIQAGHLGHRLPIVLGENRLSEGSRNANKFQSAKNVWKIYREVSNLPLPRAVSWFSQYAWNSFWMQRRCRP